MKLNEIVTPQVSRVSKDAKYNPEQSLRGTINSQSWKQGSPLENIGAGAYATVFAHKNKPGTVIKVGMKSSDNEHDDGYVQFLNTILKNNRTFTNPFLPRVYKFKLYPDNSYVAEIEKLYDLDQIDVETLNAICRPLFYDWPEETAWAPIATLSKFLKHPEKIKDKKLLQAMALINNTIKRQKKLHNAAIAYDLGWGNIMLRLTSVGPQLVLTDPLA